MATWILWTCLLTTSEPESQRLHQERVNTGIVAMEILLAWSAANIIAGGAGLAIDDERRPRRYFHQMNAAWNVVNAGIATAGLLGLRGELGAEPSALEAFKDAASFEKILLLNAGLDVAYIAAGSYLNERGRRTDSDRLRGYGRSLWLQGGFLLIFDLLVYAATHRHTNAMFDALQVTPTGVAVTW